MYKNLINVALFGAMFSLSGDALSRVEPQDSMPATHEEKSNKEPEWDVLNPPFDLHEVSISTDETTWSSLDLSLIHISEPTRPY